MNQLPSGTAQPETTSACLIFELCGLIDATAKLDENRRNPHQAVQDLVAVAYRVAAAAEPILDGEAALITALREAAANRPLIPESCPDCQKTDAPRCGEHAGGTAFAETYHELGHALSGPSYTPAPATGPATTGEPFAEGAGDALTAARAETPNAAG
ncbi:hypothetical protein [Actinomadura chibensis]|uniref:Uncharacterized protein n=1 Tax=Actinomadura chibensis TaxID=392828 RepID=A0A5D0N8S1_9ACTN|nr:hypothetical protein [Actinomadura chibensis]TYB40802.1 hypothetical protein FXF69_37925 [Actinomadura chibensis]